MPRSTVIGAGPPPSEFIDLVRLYPPRAIRDEAGYDNTIEVVNALVRAVDPTEGQSDYLETLTVLVEAYERVHHAIDTSDMAGPGMVEFFAEEHGLSAPDLAHVLGVDQATVADLLAGREPITADQARTLGKRFAVSPGLFIA